MSTYAAGATVERRYPGPSQGVARTAAEPQVQAFLAAGWMISAERWIDDTASGAPIGDAIATGAISYLAGSGGNLAITFVAARDTDLPTVLPAYTETDPRADTLESIAAVRVAFGVIALIVILIIFATMAGQMGHQPGFGPPVVGP
jgi:hypothetical protein